MEQYSVNNGQETCVSSTAASPVTDINDGCAQGAKALIAVRSITIKIGKVIIMKEIRMLFT